MSRLFSTSSDFLSNSAPPFTLTPFTLSCWIRCISLLNQCTIVTIGSSGISNHRWSIQLTATTQVGAQAFDTTSNSVNSAVTILDANWHLCVCTFASDDTTKTATLDNNAPVSGGALRNPVLATPVVRISGNPNNAASFSGLVAHIGMWNRVLNAAEIGSLFTNPPSYVAAASLLEYWPLNNNQSPEPSFGLTGTNLTVNGTTFNSDDPFGYPPVLMGQGYM